jgi:hypothetical protein
LLKPSPPKHRPLQPWRLNVCTRKLCIQPQSVAFSHKPICSHATCEAFKFAPQPIDGIGQHPACLLFGVVWAVLRLFESRFMAQKQVKGAIRLSIEGTLSFREIAATRKSKQAESPVIQNGKNMGQVREA